MSLFKFALCCVVQTQKWNISFMIYGPTPSFLVCRDCCYQHRCDWVGYTKIRTAGDIPSCNNVIPFFTTFLLPSFLYVVEQNSELSRLEESQLEILIWLYSLEEVAGVLDGNLMFCPTTTLREFKDRNTSSDLAGQAVLAETLVSQDDSLKWNRMVDEVKKNKH